MASTFTRRRALVVTAPMILANAAVPLSGVVDTAVIGATGDATDLGGIALGVLIFNIFYWSLGFLRMSSTGLVAQAHGAGATDEMQRVLARALLLAATFGIALVLLQTPIVRVGFALFVGAPDAEAQGAAYVHARIWGAPFALAQFALSGWLIGQSRTGSALAMLATTSAVNIVLDLVFVLGWGLGVGGVGAATAIADVAGAGVGGLLVARQIARGGGIAPAALHPRLVLERAAMRRLLAVNANIMIRTWSLVFGFAWFLNRAATLGGDQLAAVQVLSQFITLSAFVLDAFAYTVEGEVGRAIGRRSRPDLRRAVRVTSELAAASGVILSVLIATLGPALIDAVIADAAVADTARAYLIYCALAPLVGAAAWQLDGIFIGATRGAAMRNAGIASLAIYLVADLALTPAMGAHGLWLAWLGFYLARAGALLLAYPRLERAVE